MNNRYLFKLILILFVYSIVPIQGSGTLSASVPHSHSAMFDIPQAALLPGSDTCLPPANLIISSCFMVRFNALFFLPHIIQ